MKVLVMSDAHIVKDLEHNMYWCRTAVHGYDFWKRYLDVFEEVNVVARVKTQEEVDANIYTRADGPNVHFIELPFIRGTKGYIFNYFKLKRIFKNIITDEQCGVFRVPSLPTFMLLDEFKKKEKPYCLEVIVDPMDAYKSNKIAQFLLTNKLKKECKIANGVSYVTQYYLEKKYPSKSIINKKITRDYFNSYYSSINLDESFFYTHRSYDNYNDKTLKIIHVVSAINSDVKGHTTLLNVVQQLKKRKIDVSLTCVGDGDKRSYYEQMAEQLGIKEIVHFTGLFSNKSDLRNLLIDSDLFLFPSQAEGLPRVLIEAMAVGLPCLSTHVNGIPELLDSEYLFDPFDVQGFTNKIVNLRNHPEELNEMSKKNIIVAEKYKDTELRIRRIKFYRKLRALCEE